MLSVPQLEANKKKFLETNEKYKILTDELLTFFGDDLYTAPASTTLDMYGCFPGGLLNTTIKACKYAIQINDLLPVVNRVSKESIVKCTFISQIGKVFMLIPNPSEWHKKNLGKMYDFRETDVKLKSSERSIYYASRYGVSLTEEEFQAVINYEKDSDDKQAKYFSLPLTQIIKQGFDLAILEEKNGKN